MKSATDHISGKARWRAVAASVFALSWGVTAGAMVRPAVAAAQEKQYDFNIPRGRLSEAIPTFIRVTDAFIVHPDFKNLNTLGVKGRMTATQALEALLQGTGLEIAHKDLNSPPTYRIEEVKPTLGAPKSQEVELPNIYVTARRRLEDIQNVPWSIEVLTSKEIEQRRLYNLTDLPLYVPGLDIQDRNPTSLSIVARGTGAAGGLPTHGAEAGFGVYVDGVFHARYGQMVSDQLDVDQLEFIQGPQGTFYGKNTGLGALNITTKAPSFVPEAQGEITVGNYDYRHFRAIVSGPVVDGKLAARLFIAETNRKGWVRNVRTGEKVDDYNNLTGRGQLLFTPTEDISFRLIADYTKQDTNCCDSLVSEVVTRRVDGSPLPRNFYDRTAQLGYTPLPVDPFARKTDIDAPLQSDMTQAGVSGTLNWSLGRHNLTSITAWRRWKATPYLDIDNTALPVFRFFSFRNALNQYTQEVRLASRADQQVTYTVGGFFYHLDFQFDPVRSFGSAAPIWILGGDNPVTRAALVDAGIRGRGHLKVDHAAAFGQASIKVLPDLTFAVGLRFTREEKKGRYEQIQVGGVDLATLPPSIGIPAGNIRRSILPTFSVRDKLTDNDLSGDASLTYALNKDTNLYFTFARGVKSPAFNLQSPSLGTAPPAKSEKVYHFEGGLKALTMNKRLSARVSLFWTIIDDFQANVLQNTGEPVLGNAEGLRARGVDISLQAQPIQGFTLRAAGIYNDAEFTSYRSSPCPVEYFGLQTVCDLTGRQLPNAPKWSFNGSADYAWLVGEVEPFVGFDVMYRSSQNWSSTLSVGGRTEGYFTTDARLGARAAHGRWEVFAWAKNLFDEDYFQFRLDQSGNTGVVVGVPADPRTYGVTLRVKY